MSIKALIDGDIVIYRAGFAVDKTLYQLYLADEASATPVFETVEARAMREFIAANPDDYEVVRKPAQGDLSAALAAAKSTVLEIVDDVRADEVATYLTGSGNYRDDVATYKKYKGNRDSARRPLFYDEIKKYLIDVWGATLVEGHEADDELAIVATESSDMHVSSVICSIDKDLLQIPATHYNWVNKKVTPVTFKEGAARFFRQVLTGDRTDNVFGCPGVGDKTADKIVAGTPKQHLWEKMIQVYTDALHNPKRLPNDMRFDGTHLYYDHWKTGEMVVKTVEEYIQEVAQLVFIKHDREESWPIYLKTLY